MLWKIFFVALSMTYVLGPATAKPCFITNCPPGGKRSLIGSSLKHSTLIEPTPRPQCAVCGPGDSGRCFGPDLCCSPTFGCYFKTKETGVCLLANLTSTNTYCDQSWWEDELKAVACRFADDGSRGVCIADGLCCSTGKCELHHACRQSNFGNGDLSPVPLTPSSSSGSSHKQNNYDRIIEY